MKSIFQTKVLKIILKVQKKQTILKNHAAVSFLLGLASVSVMILMTGALYFRNEARIFDGGEVFRTFTMYDTLEEILDEQNIEIGEYDRVDFGGITDGEAKIVIHRSLNIPVEADNGTVLVECAYNEEVKDILRRSGLTIDAQDVVEPAPDTVCSELSGSVKIHRGYPVYVEADGKVTELSAYRQTVAQVLERAGIELQQDDYIDCDFHKVLEEGETVSVTRVRYEEIETYEVVPYNTVTEKSNLVSMYTSEITQKGVNGTRTNTSRVKYVNGIRISETAVSSEITSEPVNEVISVGTALRTPYSKKDSSELVLENGLPVSYESVITGKSVGYTAPIGSGTASGRKLEIGTVAVDPNIIPYGSELYIVSTDGSYVYGYAIAADTGDLTQNGVLVDLYMGNSEDYYPVSVDYGAKQVNIYVLSRG